MRVYLAISIELYFVWSKYNQVFAIREISLHSMIYPSGLHKGEKGNERSKPSDEFVLVELLYNHGF